MAEESDIKDLDRRIDEALDAMSIVSKNAMEYTTKVREMVVDLRKQLGDPLKTAEKEIADLKTRVKDIETKLAKMPKK
ncbi:MAG TPA: hypothetical protein VK843_13040 [Planctomycetota bacterium]|nr:hypothetical protein [Planctomycetota bacterium]